MTTATHKELVRTFIDEVMYKGNQAFAQQALTPNAIYHSFPAPVPNGPTGILMMHNTLIASFPDAHYTIEDLIAEDDKVVARLYFKGTQKGPMAGFPATNKTFTQAQIHVFRVQDGKITEHWFTADDLGMLRQLGLLSSLGNTSTPQSS